MKLTLKLHLMERLDRITDNSYKTKADCIFYRNIRTDPRNLVLDQ